jgi:hypothetical protein
MSRSKASNSGLRVSNGLGRRDIQLVEVTRSWVRAKELLC